MKNFFSRIFLNLKIVIFALIISVALVIVVKNPDLFKASVLLMEDRQAMFDNQRDIGYKTTGNVFDVFLSDQIKDFTDLDFTITFDNKNVSLDTQKLVSQLKYTISNPSPDEVTLKLSLNTGIDYSQSLFTIPFSGTNPLVLLSESKITKKDYTVSSLSIGKLDDYKSVHQD